MTTPPIVKPQPSAGQRGANRIVIGTRGSALALWQARHIAAELGRTTPGLETALEIIVTEGDRFQSGPVIERGGKGVWVKEIEEALLRGAIDLAVHSLKDVPAALAPGLVLAAIPERADARDVLISRSNQSLAALPGGSRVGTSSLRRVCLLRTMRPDLEVELLRGNVDTRLRKVAEGVVDAAVLAAAGLDRLGFSDRIAQRLSVDEMLPAIGQGALAIETRANDARVREACLPLVHPDTEIAVTAERALLFGLGVGCRTPVAGHAVLDGDGDEIWLRGLVGRPDASLVVRDEGRGRRSEAARLGREMAERMLRNGADRILAELGEL
jgi:hydroxymethylbilane synthase